MFKAAKAGGSSVWSFFFLRAAAYQVQEVQKGSSWRSFYFFLGAAADQYWDIERESLLASSLRQQQPLLWGGYESEIPNIVASSPCSVAETESRVEKETVSL